MQTKENIISFHELKKGTQFKNFLKLIIHLKTMMFRETFNEIGEETDKVLNDLPLINYGEGRWHRH